MTSELQSEPFYKPNVLAMLNTLFPPSMKDMPNDKVDIRTLQKHRATFYKHILTVEQQGTGVVQDFVKILLVPGTKHSWPETRRQLEEYMTLANIMISQAKAVDGLDFFHDSSSVGHSRSTSNACSAYSDRPPTSSSANTSYDDRRFSISSAINPVATNNNNISNTREAENLFESDSRFEPPAVPDVSSTNPTKKNHSTPSEYTTSGAILAGSSTNSLSTGRKSTTSSSPRTVSLSIRIPPVTVPAHEKYSPTHPSPLADSEMRAIRRVIYRSAIGTPEVADSTDSEPSYIEPTFSTILSDHKTQLGELDFLSRPYQPNDSSSPNLVQNAKRKKSFSELFLRRKSSIPREAFPAYDRSSSESVRTEPNRLKKLKSTSNLDKGQRTRAWTESPDLPLRQPASKAKEVLGAEGNLKSLPDMRAKKSFSSLGRSRAPKHLNISQTSSFDVSPPRTLRSPRTPLFSRPKTPKTPTHEVDPFLPTLGSAGLVDDSENARKSALPIPLMLRKRVSKGRLRDEEEMEIEKDKERRWLIDKSLRERSQSRERVKAAEEAAGTDVEANTPQRKNSKKEMVWQDGGASGKASGWVEFEMPRKVPPVPALPPKSALRGNTYQ